MTKRSDLDSRISEKLKNPAAWSRVWISPCAERALRPDNPNYLRLADLAVALAPANGHTNIKAGELAAFLDVTGRTVDRAIADAVRFGLLAPGSTQRCLVLPAAVDGFCIRRNPNARSTEQEKGCAVCHRGRPARPASCHPDKPVHAKGLCNTCYNAKLRSESATTTI